MSASAILCAIACAQTYGVMAGDQLEAEADKATEQWVIRSGMGRRRADFKAQMLGAYILAMVDPPSFHLAVREAFRV